MEKHKFASISLTARDRVISSKFSTHRVSKQCTIGNFQKNFFSPKMAAILNFSNFCQKRKKQKFASISLTVQDRFRAKLMLPFGWTLRMPMRPISSLILP